MAIKCFNCNKELYGLPERLFCDTRCEREYNRKERDREVQWNIERGVERSSKKQIEAFDSSQKELAKKMAENSDSLTKALAELFIEQREVMSAILKRLDSISKQRLQEIEEKKYWEKYCPNCHGISKRNLSECEHCTELFEDWEEERENLRIERKIKWQILNVEVGDLIKKRKEFLELTDEDQTIDDVINDKTFELEHMANLDMYDFWDAYIELIEHWNEMPKVMREIFYPDLREFNEKLTVRDKEGKFDIDMNYISTNWPELLKTMRSRFS